MSSKNYSGQTQEEAYEALCSVEEEIKRTAEFNPDPLPGKFLVEPLSVLTNKPSSSWTKNDVMPVVKLLSGRIVVDGVGENLEGAQLYAGISEKLAEYLCEHPDIHAIMDLVYVVADLSTIKAAIPVHQYPPSGNPATPVVPLMGTTHTWVFQGQEGLKRAQHFIGWLQDRIPGIRSMVFVSPNPAVYY
ncbi:hypothetical protein RhiirA5_395417 [Rhizophagus irregularis]|uniref:Uncharacterized protein n=3 Tax=Rhizophagus irregularis TaxID=588596 RepID=A0A2I1DV22_9GLOM|nr:hypothetical protein GLOIN_2v1873345 [Rhizophagus irregularis DAOM 181602=DAOM 197198]EXX74828.1 hypothetical protein RirG_047540 [Rhizophagus irregularis DAOM 197198w]PKC14797.1 hypothetical protein RhiirA5_395417 [Rhizophagus irregularis]PKC74185.1 hypothetical protein RhiirA1_529816 [Rhizophagus irregularis]PKY13728.1 hypothetical protein RhiirB3_519057 [Rhizophagus irregularis]POG74720.1 hypothetical protein GLOIN_2v1873345 [Rhizophagus irregularis DAOM 181602=DAOM 197198]|eukprot:XP_025181586.1 hypothetical protein GLOIN_2v1873345 [Rhizophagus irregularis DAOM 181602=DAOM 197198]